MRDDDLDRVARRAAAGDRAAFASLCRACEDDVWRYCCAVTGDPELGREAAQETFVRAVTAIGRFRGDGPVRVWLLVLARRACAGVLRRERRAPVPAPVPDNVMVTADDSGRLALLDLVGALPVELRQAFVLTQVLGLPYQRAAEVSRCRVGTIRSRVYRARARLVAALEGREGGGLDDTGEGKGAR